MELYKPNTDRYHGMKYTRCGQSGIHLPALSLGLWHNFGDSDDFGNAKKMLLGAFDRGINHFDLANNYGPSAGSAETTLGKVLAGELKGYRDELLISTKAGYDMWPGPFGSWGSRKHIIASMDQSLRRMKLDYVDIFYHHRPDPDTPLEESMGALAMLVQQGKALYVGLSNYNAEDSQRAFALLEDLGVPCLIHQARYSMFDRNVEKALLPTLDKSGVGCIAFSPLAQGLLTDKYIDGIPVNSRMAKATFLTENMRSDLVVGALGQLQELARSRGQKINQMAIAWLLNQSAITSVLVGASSIRQLTENLQALDHLQFSEMEQSKIEQILAGVFLEKRQPK